jgi:hypothetical protein
VVKSVKCSRCGKVDYDRRDETGFLHIGTAASMSCYDCNNGQTAKATLCRDCCPTRHGTDDVELDYDWQDREDAGES